jgi:ribosomal protein L39E
MSQQLRSLTSNLDFSGQLLAKAMKKNARATPHYSLKTLRRMGHPYAKRHWSQVSGGEWKPMAGTPAEGIHDPEWLVHRQSGALIRGIKKGKLTPVPEGFEILVGIPDSDPAAEVGRYVVYGTKTMVPRNFIWNTAMQNLPAIRSLFAMRTL